MRPSPTAALQPFALAVAVLLSGCTVYQAPPQRVYVQPAPPPVYAQPVPLVVEPALQPVISIYVEPPIQQPEPILVAWAPPPMLVESPAPLPFGGAVWIGGYWVWEGNWVWAAGRWAPPPRPNYAWVHPYYENRDGAVVFITGYWGPPGVVFVPPALNLRLTLVTPSVGVVAGLRPIGPPGVFVPAPPGSRLGLIVPAPIGTAPAVVTSAAPVVNVGMRIQNSNTTRVTNMTNISNVTIVAPATATANGRAFESAVPAQAHLAAALAPVIRATAPTPVSTRPIPAFVAGRAPIALPPPQGVPTGAAPAPIRPTAANGPVTATPAMQATRPGTPAPPAALAQSARSPAATAAPTPMPGSPGVAADRSARTPVPAPPGADARPATEARKPSAPVPPPKGAAASRDEAQARAEQDRMAKAPPAPHLAPKAQDKKSKEEAERERVEKK